MLARRGLALALAALTLGVGAGGASAAGVATPPAGTPNLALMVIQPSDLVPGAVIGTQAYVTPPSGFTADFGSVFTSASTPDGTDYLAVEDFVALAPSATLAANYFAAEQSEFETAKGRAELTRGIIKSAGKKAHLKAKNVRYSAVGSAGLGTSSLTDTVSLTIRHRTYQQLVVLFQDGDLAASLEVTGTSNETVPQADAVTLAGAIQSHIDSVLESTGATGLTGAT